MTNSVVVIVTLINIDVRLSLLKQRSEWVSLLILGEPAIIGENGKLLRQRLRHARVAEADIMKSECSSQGIETLDQIKFVILERNGKISVIPAETR